MNRLESLAIAIAMFVLCVLAGALALPTYVQWSFAAALCLALTLCLLTFIAHRDSRVERESGCLIVESWRHKTRSRRQAIFTDPDYAHDDELTTFRVEWQTVVPSSLRRGSMRVRYADHHKVIRGRLEATMFVTALELRQIPAYSATMKELA